MNSFVIKKKFGQNFIKDQNLLNKIIDHLTINEDDLVIEIGPGQGDLTKAILKNNCYYLGYEIDENLFSFLNCFNNIKQKIIYGDFLQKDINDDIRNIPYKKLYVVGNLPYYITTPIIKKIISDKVPLCEMLLMIQKEVADRFCSNPRHKEYGSITVYLNNYFNIERIIDLKNDVFFPKPKVDSAVLKFTKITPLINEKNEKKFNQLLKDSFQFKRKTIKNNLRDYNLDVIEKILLKHGQSLQSRAEEIPVDVFVEMVESLN